MVVAAGHAAGFAFVVKEFKEVGGCFAGWRPVGGLRGDVMVGIQGV